MTHTHTHTPSSPPSAPLALCTYIALPPILPDTGELSAVHVLDLGKDGLSGGAVTVLKDLRNARSPGLGPETVSSRRAEQTCVQGRVGASGRLGVVGDHRAVRSMSV